MQAKFQRVQRFVERKLEMKNKDMEIGRTAICRWVEQYRAKQQDQPGTIYTMP